MQKDFFVDSGAFDESNPECNSHKMLLAIVDEDQTDFDTSCTDLSDQETGLERTKYMGKDNQLSRSNGRINFLLFLLGY